VLTMNNVKILHAVRSAITAIAELLVKNLKITSILHNLGFFYLLVKFYTDRI